MVNCVKWNMVEFEPLRKGRCWRHRWYDQQQNVENDTAHNCVLKLVR